MINVGLVGLGFMGMIHYLAYQRMRGVRVVAMCEKDQTRLSGDWRSIKGNFGPAGTMMDLSGIARYTDLDQMLAESKLDMIDVCLPPWLHAPMAIAGLEAGKHVFCEKPIALHPADAERMVNTAKRAGKLLAIGHVLPFAPPYKFVHEAVVGGRYGRLLGGCFKRVISDPLWLPDFYNPDTTGGPMIDLFIHDTHFVRLLCGMPSAVNTAGTLHDKVLERFTTQFIFDDPALTVTGISGVIGQQGRPFTNAFEVYLEKATLLFDFAVIGNEGVTVMPLTVLDHRGKVVRPKLAAGDDIDPFKEEIGEVLRAIRTGKPSPLLGGDLARDALVLCQRQTESAVKKRRAAV